MRNTSIIAARRADITVKRYGSPRRGPTLNVVKYEDTYLSILNMAPRAARVEARG